MTNSNWKKAPAASPCVLGASTRIALRRYVARSGVIAALSISNPSAIRSMIRRFGIDTSVLVRLLTGEPAADFAYCVSKLSALVEEDGSEIFASTQVIGEAYASVGWSPL